MDDVSPISYRIERSWTKKHATLIFALYKRGLEAISLTERALGQARTHLPIKTPPPNNPLTEVYQSLSAL